MSENPNEPRETPGPEHDPAWRAALIRVAGWRVARGRKFRDDELADFVRAEFTRVGSPFFGYHERDCFMSTADDVPKYRVILIHPDGRMVTRDASSDAEALGLALAELFKPNS